MNIWAFDLATNTGVAMGSPPDNLTRLNSFTVRVRVNKEEDMWDLALNFKQFLVESLRAAKRIGGDAWPDMIVYEAPISPNANFAGGRNDTSLLLPFLLVLPIREIGKRASIRIANATSQTVRKGFVQRKNLGSEVKIKEAVLQSCRDWGYIPENCKDDNRADAVALWHYAQLRWGKWQPRYEVLFGKKVVTLPQRSA